MKPLTRRRFIALSAAGAAATLLSGGSASAEEPLIWRGNALGADASLELYAPDRQTGRKLLAECLAELERLEQIFSLYRDDSSLVQLNRAGRLASPPAELVELLSISRHFSERTAGAFDVTVQPLWVLYADHFSQPAPDPHGPPEAKVAATRRLVDWRGLSIEPGLIAFDREGMAVTLNSVGQGYVTDKIAALLRRRGMTHVLVDMGEIQAIGTRPDGTPWRVGLESGGEVSVIDRGVSTSSPDGTRFSPVCNHIFDPSTGHCSQLSGSVTVIATSATVANALSTSLAVGGRPLAQRLDGSLDGAQVIFRDRNMSDREG
jgi:thiamine biosynthesis lipoprotein